MINWGITSGSHDAALTVMQDDKILFASHSERFSGIKNDKILNSKLLEYALNFGYPDKIYFYENVLNKKIRQFFSGQYELLFNTPFQDVEEKLIKDISIERKIKFTPHHLSHAASGYFTSNFNDATILVIDSIGEWDTTTIWSAKNKRIKKRWRAKYPNSLGLFYSAMTQRIGLKPNEEEYILMGMSALGNPEKYYEKIKNDFFKNSSEYFVLSKNLHRGCNDWLTEIDLTHSFDIAAATQKIFEEEVIKLAKLAKKFNNSNNLILSGGCALNCVANSKIMDLGLFNNVWIMPNPGDAGSSLGCILAHTKQKVSWINPLLGYNIPGQYPINDIITEICQNKIVGVACGPAEFGPRALGNRSILADPRGEDIKNIVNKIKQREPFRPFAPVILEERVNDFFEMPKNVEVSPYMQFVAKCRYPDKFPAIVHYDNTSRVQTVNEKEFPDLYKLLKKWNGFSGCPMLLNTSLNIKGNPLVNSEKDANDFETLYNLKVLRGI